MVVAHEQPSPRLRAQVRATIVTVAAVAVGLFGVPLAVAVQQVVRAQAVTGLQRDATRAVAFVPDNVLEVGDPVALPTPPPGTRLAVYGPSGVRVAGAGPARSTLAAAAADGHEHDGGDHGDVAVVVPVLSDTTVVGAVRAALPDALLWRRTLLAWAALALLAGVVLAVVAAVARRAARRISRPFEQITEAARSLGTGVFDVTLPHWGLAEADAAGSALEDSGRRIGELVRAERTFTRDVSHQLRTPLTGLVVGLEASLLEDGSSAPVRLALERARHLERTIDDLLAVRATPTSTACDPVPVLSALVGHAQAAFVAAGRSLALRLDDTTGPVAVPAAVLRQAAQVLLDNALAHGAGATSVTLEPYGVHAVVEVADDGPGLAPGTRPGTGLALAASLVEAHGGDLLVRRRAPHPRMALLLPMARGGPPVESQSAS